MLRIDNMDKEQMQKALDQVCIAWNDQIGKPCASMLNNIVSKEIESDFRQCKHKFTKYDTLGDNTRSYYCALCGLCK